MKLKKKKKETEPKEIYGEREEKETEPMDIYNETQREEMLKDDEITEAESAFMEGREMKVGKKKKGSWREHKDTTSVELAEEEYTED